MTFRILGTNHTSFTVSNLDRTVGFFRDCLGYVRPIAPPATIDQGPNKGRSVVYLRDWDGVTIELIEVAAK